MLLRQGAVYVHSEGVLRVEVRTIQNGVLSFVNKDLRHLNNKNLLFCYKLNFNIDFNIYFSFFALLKFLHFKLKLKKLFTLLSYLQKN